MASRAEMRNSTYEELPAHACTISNANSSFIHTCFSTSCGNTFLMVPSLARVVMRSRYQLPWNKVISNPHHFSKQRQRIVHTRIDQHTDEIVMQEERTNLIRW